MHEPWNYSVNDAAVQFLGVGDSITETYTVTLTDGETGGIVTRDVVVTITGTNDQAVIGVADLLGAVTEGNGAPAALTDTGTIAFSDVDLTDTHSASAAFTSTTGAGQLGTLSASVSTDTTGSGTGGVVTWNYSVNDAAVQFLGVGDSITETYTVTLTDGETGGIVTRDVVVTITGTNDQAVVTTNGSLSYNENQAPTAINPALTISDVDSSTLTGATVSITGNFASGQDVLAFTNQNGISGSYNATTGVLTLTGAATVAQYQAALELITYFNVDDNPSGATRTVSFQVNDGAAANNLSNVATATVIVTPVNDAPVIDVDGDGASTFTTGGPTIVIDSSIPITDADSTQLQGATVQITAGLQSGDILNFTNQNGITGSYNGATGLLTLSGAAFLADYQAALQSITFGSTSNSTTQRTVTFQVTDTGNVASATDTAVINVVLGDTTPPVVTNLSITSAAINFVATDAVATSLSLVSPFAAAFGNPTITSGAPTTLTPTEQASVVTGTLQVTDGANPASVVGLSLGTSAGNVFSAGSSAAALYGFGGDDTLTGGSAADWLFGGLGNDTLVGAQNDLTLDGGANTDTLQVGANFTSTGDAQIINIENVTLTSAVTLNLSNQTEAFVITGSSGADSITGGGSNDTIIGAQNDTLLDGGAGANFLQIGANFTSSSNAQIANIAFITLTAAATLNLANQTEAFQIFGSTGSDLITGGAGNDQISGAQNDTLLNGSGGTDLLLLDANFTSTSDAQLANIEISLTHCPKCSEPV